MGAAAAAGGGLGVLGGYLSSQGRIAEADYNQQVANSNATMLEQQADRQYKIGLDQMAQYGRKVNQTVGAQRAALAAGGVDVNVGSAADVQQETETIGHEDMRRIQTNAYLEALGMKSQAFNLREQANFQSKAAHNMQTASLITGGLQGFTSAGGLKGFGG